MSSKIYICADRQHNKFWSYETDGNNVTVEWGRVGGNISSQTKKFSSEYQRDRFIDKKVSEKKGKGYKEKQKDEYEQEVKTAQSLGTQYKISRLLFADKKGKKIEQITNYDPSRWVYVEVLNSWSKEIVRLLLSKSESLVLTGGITESGRKISYGSERTPSSGREFDFVQTVREVLKRISGQVVEVLKTIKFAAVGARDLFGDDEASENTAEFAAVYQSFESSGVGKQVVMKFAAVGARELDL